MPKRKLEDLVADLYEDDEVGNAVLADADRLHNREKIESGELQLPHPTDAHHWHQRKQLEAGLVKINAAPEDTVQHLMDRIAALEGQRNQPAAQDQTDQTDNPEL